jgi:hypothetical protein
MSNAARRSTVIHYEAARERHREKQRRYRGNLKAGLKEARGVWYGNDEVAFLLDLGWLDEAKSENPAEVGAAISRLIADSSKAHRNR